MQVELLEILDFLAAHHPFDQLPDEVLSTLPPKLEVRYARRETEVVETEGVGPALYIIRTGAVEIHSPERELLARLGEGDFFGHRASPHGARTGIQGIAIEDSLLYRLPAKEVDALCERFASFAYFFSHQGGERLRGAVSSTGHGADTQLSLMTTPIRDLLTREPVHLPPTATIREAAERMSEEIVSSILVVEQGHLFGIVTDRDLRLRVIAKGVDYNVPIYEVMTGAPLALEADAVAYEALLLMARYSIHHLPVVSGTEVVGVVTATDFAERHTTSAVHVAGDIYKQNDYEGLKAASARIPQLLVNLAAASATAKITGQVITGVGDAVLTRLLQLAEMKFGPPPVDYAWVAAGSQARYEQLARSDQDNCLILDDRYDPQRHGEYFREFAKFVCDGLNACGYVYCPGKMMAMTDEWRQPLSTWKRYFDKWIDAPQPKALMLTCVFFDMRHMYGDEDIFTELRRYVLEKTRGNRIFLAYMAVNALSHQPPLGFFRNFVLIRGGQHDRTFDLKHNGIVPIVDLARVYALSAGVDVVNTPERLSASIPGGEVTAEGAQDLRETLEFINSMRIQHQARQLRAGQEADNFMSPDDLSHFERNHLRDAFSVVRSMQNTLGNRFQVSKFT